MVARVAVAFACLVVVGGVRYASLGEPAPVLDPASPAWKQRESALQRAGALMDERVDVSLNERDLSSPLDVLRCEYVPKPIGGTTPKFDCRLPAGDVIKIKYGRSPEVPAEIAATHLLLALGFAADHVWRVTRVECVGCPPHPFRSRQLAEMLFLEGPYERMRDVTRVRVFKNVAAERKFEARAIEPGGIEGWDWSDLDRVAPLHIDRARAEIDALRLVAVLLAHWDNKAPNQRLVCLDAPAGQAAGDANGCRRPFLMLQDLGATFGPRKMNHARWAETPIWESESTCVATMASLPYGGATFRPVRISEDGRLLLATRLARLDAAAKHAIFREAGFPSVPAGGRTLEGITPWVEALDRKIANIADHRPCESGT